MFGVKCQREMRDGVTKVHQAMTSNNNNKKTVNIKPGLQIDFSLRMQRHKSSRKPSTAAETSGRSLAEFVLN